jgi:hypothetical protein
MMERQARELHRVAGYWQGGGLLVLVAWFFLDHWAWLAGAALCFMFWAHMNGRAHGIREALKFGEGRASLPPERKD